ncbi:MAG TPA: MFS transporter [Candidatus Acidoferrales bacterium]|nr:MFS transporter [Candidatus Acidoferrales bacterium]
MATHTDSSTTQNKFPANWRTGFWSLIATQFQGAFSDNFLKWVTIFLVLALGLPQARRDRLVVLVIPLLFALPFLLFSMTGGYLADHYSKRSVTIGTKVMEIVIVILATAGLAFHSLAIPVAAVFLIGCQAALFGPSKYGLLPELLPDPKLSWGNGILELGTFLAILIGTIAGGLLASEFAGREFWNGLFLVALAVAGLACSKGISRVSAANPARTFRWNPAGELWDEIGLIRRDRVLWAAVLGNIYFWFLGSLVLINIILYAADILRVGSTRTSLLMAATTLGIGLGSVAAGYLSRGRIEQGLIGAGALGITAMAALLAVPHIRYVIVAALLGALGFFAGFFAVPINAIIQHQPEPDRKGSVIAAANLLSFVGIALQPIAQYALLEIGHPNPAKMFLIIAGLTLGAAIFLAILMPDSLRRVVAWIKPAPTGPSQTTTHVDTTPRP